MKAIVFRRHIHRKYISDISISNHSISELLRNEAQRISVFDEMFDLVREAIERTTASMEQSITQLNDNRRLMLKNRSEHEQTATPEDV
jgi:mannitol-specific phosphotransferase system IIBC component